MVHFKGGTIMVKIYGFEQADAAAALFIHLFLKAKFL